MAYLGVWKSSFGVMFISVTSPKSMSDKVGIESIT